MENHTQKFKIRLGLFVIGGLAIFMLAVFIIGKQKNLFNPVFKLTTTFSNVSGLLVGNNVRFSGINVGTVDNIVLINDTAVRVDLMIKRDVWQFIKSDCKVTLGSEGIIGDKLLIITQGSAEAPLAKAGQQLESLETIETHTIMSRLDVTTANAEAISRQLSEITFDINMGKGTLSRLIQDSILAENLNQTIANLNRFSKGLIGADVIMLSLKRTAFNAEDISKQLADVINKINKGDGTLGRLIQDTTIAANLKQTALNLRKTSNGLTGTDSIMAKLNTSLSNIEVVSKQLTLVVNKINKGNGTISRLLGDSIMAENLNQAIISLKSSSKGLDENMTAAKHNFLFRGYFERKAKETEQKKQKMAQKDTTFKTDIQ
jgi:phospholipid/cholesterol/gamma-HCH transport system substrate-binding protein